MELDISMYPFTSLVVLCLLSWYILLTYTVLTSYAQVTGPATSERF